MFDDASLEIGENSAPLRAALCRKLAWLGLTLDEQANAAGGPRISTPESRVSVWVIPTNEELMIAQHTLAIVRAQGAQVSLASASSRPAVSPDDWLAVEPELSVLRCELPDEHCSILEFISRDASFRPSAETGRSLARLGARLIQ